MTVIQVIKRTFDSLENHDPMDEEVVATFHDDEDKTAFTKAEDYLRSLKNVKLYLGYDMEVYPKFFLKKLSTR